MARVRYVILAPVVIEDEIIGDDDFMTDWGKQHAERYEPVESLHPRQEAPYTAKLVEAVRLDEPDEITMDDLVTPGFAA